MRTPRTEGVGSMLRPPELLTARARYESGGTAIFSPATRLFERSAFDGLLLEYDDERSGGFEPLAHVPESATVVLGRVTTKKADMDSAQELTAQIDNPARYVPLDRLALSPRCAFASMTEGSEIGFDGQRAKLEPVTSVAGAIWG
jgi:5-methyltetrahydropteroyltriglutamate--homocysteine methyltransferase